MVTDAKLYFDEEVAITTSKMSTNVIDLKSIKDVAKGSPIYLNLHVTTAFSVDTETVDFVLCASSGADPASTDTVVTAFSALAVSSVVLGKLGYTKRIALPEDIPYSRLGVSYVATTAVATGKVSVFLSIGQDNN